MKPAAPIRPSLSRSQRGGGRQLEGDFGEQSLRKVLPRAQKLSLMKKQFSGLCCCEAGCVEPVLFPNETNEVIEAAEESDVRIPVPTPQLPSQSDIDDHCITHIPYRSWCRFCVEGRGREMAHKEVDHGSRDVATVAFDYLFVTKKDVFTNGEWASEATRA